MIAQQIETIHAPNSIGTKQAAPIRLRVPLCQREIVEAMGTIIGTFIGGLLAIGAAVLIYNKFVKRDAGAPTGATATAAESRPPSQASAADPAAGPASGLVNLNIHLRTTHGLAPEVVERVERIIDLLNATVPQMQERHPSESLTYELNRIAADHLPQVVKEFIDLSAESRQRQAAAFASSLDDVRSQIQRAREIVEHNEVAEFKVMATFLKTKYSSGEL
jgi:hypothetical protein